MAGACCFSLHAQPNMFMVMLRFLLLSISEGTQPANRLWYLDLEALPVDPESGTVQLEGAADKVVSENEYVPTLFQCKC